MRACGRDPNRVDLHAQGRTLHVCDPFGVPLEFYYTMEQRPSLLQRYGEYRGPHIQRIDHFNCFAADVQGAYNFYSEKLGFRLEHALGDSVVRAEITL